MNNDLISRSELKNHKFVVDRYIQIGGRTNGKTLDNVSIAYQMGWNDAIDAIIDNAPTVDERPRGEWDKSPVSRFYTCSFCGKTSPDLSSYMKMNFCPNCGADMRGDVE